MMHKKSISKDAVEILIWVVLNIYSRHLLKKGKEDFLQDHLDGGQGPLPGVLQWWGRE